MTKETQGNSIPLQDHPSPLNQDWNPLQRNDFVQQITGTLALLNQALQALTDNLSKFSQLDLKAELECVVARLENIEALLEEPEEDEEDEGYSDEDGW